MRALSVSFRAIVRLAEHLAILDIRGTSFRPGGYVVGVHVFQVPDLGVIGIVADGAKRAI